jgi:hypothetical protein
VLELLGAGASFEEILKDYAFLEREDILAAIEYAAHQIDNANAAICLLTHEVRGQKGYRPEFRKSGEIHVRPPFVRRIPAWIY